MEADFQKELLAVNYVMEKDSDLCAFFSLLSDRICLYDFDSKTEFNRFRSKRFIQPYRFKGYPAIKIGRFGVKDSYKEQGIGSALLDFIKTYFLRNRRLGCRFLTVDAYKDAIPFYAKNGFIKLRSDSDRETSLMYYDLKACAVKHIKKLKRHKKEKKLTLGT